jgi:hypothetical protein
MRTRLKFLGLIGFFGTLGVGAACNLDLGSIGGRSPGAGGSSDHGGHGGTSSSSDGGAAGGGTDCDPSEDEDRDNDGFTVRQGDCNDCDALVNPNAIELATPVDEAGDSPEPVDENCDGEVDNPPEPCDRELAIDEMDPLGAARAVELCKLSAGEGDWGVVSARWVMIDGAPPPDDTVKLENFHLGHGILTGFGPNVQPKAGERLLALSSGTARQQTDPGFQSPFGFNKEYAGDQVAGFPKTPPSCPDVIAGRPFDPTAIEIKIRAPSNVRGFSFKSKFNTFDWPELCQNFNDFFLALLDPMPAGQVDGNILFDAQGAPMSVNNTFIDVCGCQGGPPCIFGAQTFACSLGTSELLGSGFESHAATGWLVTSAPVEPNQELTIRWGAYDSGAYDLDSTGLIDDWQWLTEPVAAVSTQRVPSPQQQ